MPTYHLLTPMLYSSGEIGAFRTHIVDHVTGLSILSVCVYFYSRNSCHGDCEGDQAVSSARLRWSEDCQKCNSVILTRLAARRNDGAFFFPQSILNQAFLGLRMGNWLPLPYCTRS